MSRQCLKFTIVFFNLILMLIGAAAVGLGAWVMVNEEDFLEETADVIDFNVLGSDLLETCALTMVTTGAVVFVLGTLGCVGAFSLSSFLLVFYSLALVVVLTVEVAVLVLVIVFRSELGEKIDEEVIDRMHTDYGDSSKSFTKSFDSLQKEFDCCGWENGEDFFKLTSSQNWNRTLGTGEMRLVPDSCCPASDLALVYNCTVDPLAYNATVYNYQGCKDKIDDRFDEFTWVIIGITSGLLAFQFLLMTLSLCLVVKNVGKKYNM